MELKPITVDLEAYPTQPRFLLDGWKLGGFVDVGNAGVGDRHIDLFWGAWTLAYNLKTDACRQRFRCLRTRQGAWGTTALGSRLRGVRVGR